MHRTATVCAAVVLLAGCASTADPAGLSLGQMVVLHDGDHAAATYADGVLAPLEAGHRDLLSTVTVAGGEVRTASVGVSNSVTAAPEVLALSPDGATAFVTERLGQRAAGDTMAADLEPGNSLFAVDISDRGVPVVAAEVTIPQSPEALAVSPDGTTVAVVSNTADSSVLTLVPWGARTFGSPRPFDIAEDGELATNVQWHPGGGILAVNIDNQDRVAFFQLTPEGPQPWGSVATGPDPFVGRFAPDGSHYLTSNWGRNLTATSLAERLPSEPSTISVVELAPVAGPPAHRVVATAESDRSAEGLAISPDGTWVATVNMRGSALPEGSPGADRDSSVSLLRFEAATGALEKVGDYPLTGILPEGGAFDPSGRYFVATVFEGHPGADGSGLQVYEVGAEAQPGLTPVQRIELPHGAHHVVFG
ncbi:lactonase family protein [soil metagenome]